MPAETQPTIPFEFNPEWDNDPAKTFHDIFHLPPTLANSLARRKVKPSELYNAWKNSIHHQFMNPEFDSYHIVIAAFETMVVNPPTVVELPSNIYNYLSQLNDPNSAYRFYNHILGLSPKQAHQLADAQIFPVEAMTMTLFDYTRSPGFREQGFESLKNSREQWLNSQTQS